VYMCIYICLSDDTYTHINKYIYIYIQYTHYTPYIHTFAYMNAHICSERMPDTFSVPIPVWFAGLSRIHGLLRP
jgi:hypothetical protein